MQRDAEGRQIHCVRTAAAVDGVKLQDSWPVAAPALYLLHGYAETSRMWRPLIPRLATNFTVIAPDLRGIGDSDIPKTVSTWRTRPAGARAGERAWHSESAVVGHDIGLMVAYVYAAQFPSEVESWS